MLFQWGWARQEKWSECLRRIKPTNARYFAGAGRQNFPDVLVEPNIMIRFRHAARMFLSNDLLKLTEHLLGDICVDSFSNSWRCLEVIDRVL